MPKLKRHHAEDIDEEERSWKCESCEKMIEEEIKGPHCRQCASYWEDVRNGLFDYEN